MRFSHTIHFRKPSRALIACVWLCCAPGLSGIRANPSGEVVQSGTATFDRSPDQLTITTSDRVSISWKDFSISKGETTQFIQPSSNSLAINRVYTGNPSELFGTLQSNGKIVLINPNGIMVGAGGVVDTGGFLASTLDTVGDFTDGADWTFRGDSTAAIENHGTIIARSGDLILISREVVNTGTLSAAAGTVALGGGREVLVAWNPDAARRLFVRPAGLDGSVNNRGAIEAARAELEASGGNPYALAVNNEGTIRATGSVTQDGRVYLVARDGTLSHSGSIFARNADGSGGTVRIHGRELETSGMVDASSDSSRGGGIRLEGESIFLKSGTFLNADGRTGGGKIEIGGGLRGQDPDITLAENVTVQTGVRLSANAVHEGDGGMVVVWAKNRTAFEGTISVRGGSVGGNGGFAEVSGLQSWSFPNWLVGVDVSAPAGVAGTFLIDPNDITIAAGPGAAVGGSPANANTLFADSITAFLATGNLIIETTGTGGTGNITVQTGADLTWASTNDLTLTADASLTFQSGVTVNGGGDLTLNFAQTVNGTLTFGDSLPVAASVTVSAPALRTANIVGPSNGAIFTITGTAAGTINDGTQSVFFSNIDNLTGGAGDDSFVLSGTVVYGGNINGGGAVTGDTIDFSGATGFAATVDIGGTLDPSNRAGTISGIEIFAAPTTGTQSLRGPNSGSQAWTVTSTGVQAGGVLYKNFESLDGRNASDTFTFAAGGTFSGSIVGGGGAGSDTIELGGSGQTVAISGTGAGSVEATGTFSGFETLDGGGSGILTGPNSAQTWNITGAGGGTVLSTTFQDFATLSGGTDVDTFVFGASGSLTGDLNGGNGNDVFTFSAGGSVAGTINGGGGTDTLNGLTTGSAWTITGSDTGTVGTSDFSGVETLNGGTGNDTFTFDEDAAFAGTIAGGTAGTDQIILTGADQTIVVSAAGAGSVNGAGTFSGIESLDGGDNGILSGPNSAQTWNITGSDSGTVLSMSFQGFATLNGGTAADTFVFGASGSLSGNMDGGDGADVFNFSAGGSVAGTVSGGLGTDTLTGLSTGSTWTIDGTNSGDVDGLVFTNIENITGGTGVDTFVFENGTVVGLTTGGGADILDYSGQTGSVVLNLTAGTTTGVTTLTGSSTLVELIGNGTDTELVLGAGPNGVVLASSSSGTVNSTLDFSGLTELTGGAGTDTLTGLSTGSTWTIDGTNSGDVDGLVFTNIENITGGTGVDTFVFENGTVVGLTTGGGADILDYSGQTGAVVLNLTAGSTTGVTTLTGAGTLVELIGNGTDTELVLSSGNDSIVLSGTNAGQVNGVFDFGGVTTVNGSTGTDTLTGLVGGSTWTIDGTNSGDVDGLVFTNMENITGGTGVDTFVFENGTVVGLTTGGGADILDYSGQTGAVVLNLTAGTTTGVTTLTGSGTLVELIGNGTDTTLVMGSGNDSIVLSGTNAGQVNGVFDFGGVTTVNGSTGTDTLTGLSTGSTWTIDGTNGGDVDGLAFLSMENITGGTGADTFVFENGTVVGLTTGGGADILDYSGQTGAVVVDLEDETSTGITTLNGASDLVEIVGNGSSTTLILLDSETSVELATADVNAGTAGSGLVFSGVTTLESGAGDVTLTLSDGGVTVTISAEDDAGTAELGLQSLAFVGFSDVIGGSGNDTLVLENGFELSGDFDGQGGINTLDYSGFGSAVSIDLEDSTADGIGGTFAGVSNLIGSSGAGDELIGIDAGSTWTIDGTNSGDVNGITFSGIEELNGGSGADTFVFENGSVVELTTEGGADILDYSGQTGAVVVDLEDETSTGVTTLNGAEDVVEVVGNGTSTTLILLDSETSVQLAAADVNAGTAGSGLVFSGVTALESGAGDVTLTLSDGGVTVTISAEDDAGTAELGSLSLTFVGFSDVIGGSGDDTLVLENGFELTGDFDGLGGTNTLDFSGFGSAVTVDLEDSTADGIGGTFAGVSNLIGSSGGGDELIGFDTGSTWTIDGTNSGDVDGTTFSGMEKITGSAAMDTFLFENGTVVGLTTGGGADILDYSGQTGAVVLNLTAGSTTGVTTLAGAGTLVELIGNGTDTTLVMGSGNDSIVLSGTNAGQVNGVFDFGGVTTVNGSTGTDTLTGLSTGSTWTIDGTNGGDVDGLVFTNIENITGGTGVDTFVFENGTVVGLTTGGGADILDYSGQTGAVVLNLTAGTTTGVTTLTGSSTLVEMIGNGTDTELVLASGDHAIVLSGIGQGQVDAAFDFSGLTLLTGGAGSDTLTGVAGGSIWTIDGTNSGDVDGFNFAGVENLTGGTGSDVFEFIGAATLDGNIVGGAGVAQDTIDFSQATGFPATLDIGDLDADGRAASVTGVEILIAPASGTQTLQGANSGNQAWGITATGVDAGGVVYQGFENLLGRDASDTFTFAEDATFAGLITGGGGLGTDLVVLTGANQSIALSASGTGSVNGGAGSFSGIESLDGGDNGTLTGPNSGATWMISGVNSGSVASTLYQNFTNITGGSGADTFVFENGTVVGLTTGGGADILDYSGQTGAVVLNLTAGSTTGVTTLTGAGTLVELIGNGTDTTLVMGSGNDSIVLSGSNAGQVNGVFDFGGVTTVSGSTGTDTLTGLTGGSTWTIDGTNSGDVDGLLFTNIENIAGGTGVDTFVFVNGTVVGLTTGGGADILDYSAQTGSVVLSLTAGTTTGVTTLTGAGTLAELIGNGTDSELVLGAGPNGVVLASSSSGTVNSTLDFSGLTELTGGAGTDTLTGLTGGSTWTIDGTNSGDVDGLLFTNIENIVGGTGVDTFVFENGTVVGLTTGGGADILDYSGQTGAVVLNLTAGTTTGVTTLTGAGTLAELIGNGTDSELVLGAGPNGVVLASSSSGTLNSTLDFSGLTELTGGAGTDTLTGLTGGSTWTIDGTNSGDVDGLVFTNIENITGGTGVDTFVFENGTVVGLTTGGGADILDYSGQTGAVVLNLTAGTTTGVTTLTGAGTLVELIGNGTDTTLVMGSGNDSIVLSGSNAGQVNGVFDFGGVTTVNGSTGTDTLTGLSTGSTWTIDGTNSGDVDGLVFTNIENITGGTGVDTFVFENGTVVGLTTGGGADILDYSGQTGAVVLNLTAGTTTGVTTLTGAGTLAELIGNGADTELVLGAGPNGVVLASSSSGTVNSMLDFSGLTKLTGGAGTDTLTGLTGGSTWTIDGTNSGDVDGLAFTNIENITGGTGVDTFVFENGTVVGLTTGGGADILDYSGQTGSVVLNLTAGTTTGVTTLSGVVTLAELIGNTTDTELVLGAGPNGVVLASSSSGTVNSTLEFSGLTELTGGAGTDTLTGLTGGSTWTIDGTNSGDVDGLAFSNIENITGGTGVDTFVFENGTVVGLTTGGGADILDYSGQTGSVVLNLSVGTTTGVTTLTGGANLAELIGNGANTRLVLADAESSVILGAADLNSGTSGGGLAFSAVGTLESAVGGLALTLSDGGVTVTISAADDSGAAVRGGQTLAFTGVSDLTGGTGDDTLVLQGGFGLTGAFDGGLGTDSLDYSAFGSAVSVNLETSTATGLGGGFLDIESFEGSSLAGDTLTGPSGNTVWTLGATGNLVQGALEADFSAFENLVSGAGVDEVVVNNGAAYVTFDFSAGGGDTLNYSNRTGSVSVDLSALTATGLGSITGGAGLAQISGNASDTTLVLGTGDNNVVLTGAFAGTVDGTLDFGSITTLNGGAGNDRLTGTNTGSSWNITGSNAGMVGSLAFVNVENITGGTGVDSYTSSVLGILSGALDDSGNTSNVQGVLRAGSVDLGAVNLTGAAAFETTVANGLVELGAVTGNGFSLRVSTGTGLKTFQGSVSGLNGGALAALVLEGTGNADFASTVSTTAGGIDASNAGGVVFRGGVVLGNGTVGSTFAGLVTFQSGSPLSFSGFDGLQFSGGIQVTGADITLDSQASNLTVNGLAAGGNSVTVQTGSGTADFSGGNITGLDEFTLTAALARVASVTGTGTQSYVGAVRASGTLTAPRVEFSGSGNVTAANGVSAALTAADEIFLDKSGAGSVVIDNDRSVSLSAGSALTALDLTVLAGNLEVATGVQASSRIDLAVAAGNLTQTAGTLTAPVITLTVSGNAGTSLAPIRTHTGSQLVLDLDGNAFLVESSLNELGTEITYTGGASAQTIDLTLSAGENFLAANFGDTGDDFIIRATAGGLQQVSGRFLADSLTVLAAGTIGTSVTPLLTRASDLNLTSGGGNGTFVSEFDAVAYQGSAGTGSISIQAAGTLTVSGDVTTTGDVLLRSVGGNIEGSSIAFPTITADTLELDASSGNLIFNNLSLVLNQGIGSVGNTVTLGDIQVIGNLSIVASGNVEQTGTLEIGGVFSVTALGRSIVLGDSANAFGSIRIRGASAVIAEGDSMVVDLLEVSGAASLTSGGAISQTGAITAGSLALSAAQTILLENLGNRINTLGNVVRGGLFKLFTSESLTVNGNMTGGVVTSGVEIRAADDLRLLAGTRITASGLGNDIVMAALSGDFTDLSGSATSLEPLAQSRFVIYSSNRVDTLTGLLTVNFIQLSSSYPTAPNGPGNALLVREGVPGDTTIVVVIPFAPSINIGGLSVGDFGLRSIDLENSGIGIGLRGGRTGGAGFGLFSLNADGETQEIGEEALEAMRELRRTLQEDMSAAAKDEILQALADILSGRLDPREVRLPPGLVYQEDSFGNSVIIPPELADEFLISILDPANHEKLMQAIRELPAQP